MTSDEENFHSKAVPAAFYSSRNIYPWIAAAFLYDCCGGRTRSDSPFTNFFWFDLDRPHSPSQE